MRRFPSLKAPSRLAALRALLLVIACVLLGASTLHNGGSAIGAERPAVSFGFTFDGSTNRDGDNASAARVTANDPTTMTAPSAVSTAAIAAVSALATATSSANPLPATTTTTVGTAPPTTTTVSVTAGTAPPAAAPPLRFVKPFLQENTFGFRALAFFSRVLLEVVDGANQTLLQQRQASAKNYALEYQGWYDHSHNQSSAMAVDILRVMEGCAADPTSRAIRLKTRFSTAYAGKPPTVHARLHNRNLSHFCTTALARELAGRMESLPKAPKRPAEMDVLRATYDLIMDKTFEGFMILPLDDYRTMQPDHQYHLEASFAAGALPTSLSSSSPPPSSPSPSPPPAITTAQQCIRNAHTVSVLGMDAGALKAASDPSVQYELWRNASTDPLYYNALWDHRTRASVVRDVGLSRRFESAYGFDNSVLSMDTVPAVAKKAAAKVYNWSHATFHHGPPSDGDAFLEDPFAFASTKVSWITGNGRQQEVVRPPSPSPPAAGADAEGGGNNHYNFWGDYDDELHDGNPPCTQYLQHRLHALMNPRDCGKAGEEDDRNFPDLTRFVDKKAFPDAKEPFVFDPFDTIRFHARRNSNGGRFYNRLFLGSNPPHGVGSTLQQDISGMVVSLAFGRISLTGSDIYRTFASPPCKAAGREGTECFWQAMGRCQYREAGAKHKLCYSALGCNAKVFVEDFKDINLTGTLNWLDRRVKGSLDDYELFGENFVRGTRRISPQTSRPFPANVSTATYVANTGKEAPAAGQSPPQIPKCYLRYKQWMEDIRNTNAGSQHHNYQYAQLLRYRMRHQQPWFHNMLSQGLRDAGVSPLAREPTLARMLREGTAEIAAADKAAVAAAVSAVARGVANGIVGAGAEKHQHTAQQQQSSSGSTVSSDIAPFGASDPSILDPVLFYHERGEGLKLREFVCFFQCNYVDNHIFLNLSRAYCEQLNEQFGSDVLGGRLSPKCQVYLSGNIPPAAYKQLMADLTPHLITAAATTDAASTASLHVSNNVSSAYTPVAAGTPSSSSSSSSQLYRSIRSTWTLGNNKKKKGSLNTQTTTTRTTAGNSSGGIIESNGTAAFANSTSRKQTEPPPLPPPKLAVAVSDRYGATSLGNNNKKSALNTQTPRNAGNSSSSSSSTSRKQTDPPPLPPPKLAVAVSDRYGATSLAASWVDFHAGLASSHWVCAESSQWCGFITRSKSVYGRSVCHTHFLDVGHVMRHSPLMRDRYCVLNIPRYNGCTFPRHPADYGRQYGHVHTRG